MIVENGHGLAYIAQHVLVSSFRALDCRVRGKEGLAVPGFPIQHLSAGKRILATAFIVGAVAGELAAHSLENVIVVVIRLRALARTFELRAQRIAVKSCACAFLVVVPDKVYFVRSAIGHATFPIVDHVVKNVQATCIIAVTV